MIIQNLSFVWGW